MVTDDRKTGTGLRVLVLIHNVAHTSAYFKVAEMAEALAEQGHEVTLISTSPTRRVHFTDEKQGNIELVQAPDMLWGGFRLGADIWNSLRRTLYASGRDFDVVHAIDCRPVVILPALSAQRIRNVPMLLSWWDWYGRGGMIAERSGRAYRATLGHVETVFEEIYRRQADRATVISGMLRRRLLSLGYAPDRMILQRPGCFPSRYPAIRSGKKRDDVRVALGLPTDDRIQVYVGALYRRDQNLLLESLEILNRNSTLPLTLLVGNHHLPEKTCRRLRIVLTGKKPIAEVYRYIAASDHCLLPLSLSISNLARWPAKMSDYLCAGRAVVATRASDLGLLSADHDFAYLAADDSPEAFAEAMMLAIDSPKTSKRKGIRARRLAEADFSWARVTQKLVHLYQQAIEERSHR